MEFIDLHASKPRDLLGGTQADETCLSMYSSRQWWLGELNSKGQLSSWLVRLPPQLGSSNLKIRFLHRNGDARWKSL